MATRETPLNRLVESRRESTLPPMPAPLGTLTLQDLAMILDCANMIEGEVSDRLAAYLRADPNLTEHVGYLEALVDVLGWNQHRRYGDGRLESAVICSDVERHGNPCPPSANFPE